MGIPKFAFSCLSNSSITKIDTTDFGAHDSPTEGHFGVNKILEKIWKRFY